eukprot:TRINITY_DN532_c0_g1_i1.p1 TRINITY_DN532_c0_g1~~TRINITY_DN532_c0_g1_i1.p1  ORF type:complete len:216 (-),score=34.99 TRINITY_DN532_c0_g1_i1:294-917(-)
MAASSALLLHARIAVHSTSYSPPRLRSAPSCFPHTVCFLALPEMPAQTEGSHLPSSFPVAVTFEGSDAKRQHLKRERRCSSQFCVISSLRRGCVRAGATAERSAKTASDLYEVLGIERDAGREELKRAYRQRARSVHPDVNDDDDAHEQFIILSHAYEVLMDGERRRRYDLYGDDGGSLSSLAEERRGVAWEAFDTWEEFQPFQRKI